MELFNTYIQSPVGLLEICGTVTAITAVNFREEKGVESSIVPEVLKDCAKQLTEYFKGSRKEFTVPLQAEGTAFQKRVWMELQNIGFGETISYLDLALTLRDEKLTRAVGSANGKNPIAIIIPCHRVIGESGKLTGYAGGMWRKKWLLELEGNVSGKSLTLF
ncbi:MAG: methylated-DNA--[protein]-cysteine S-methyltransferase [Chitinophagales bacterium]